MKISDDLPAARKVKVDWAEMRRIAEANPGKWVESPVSVSPSVATQIKSGKYTSINPEGLSVSTRHDPDTPGASYVYIRYDK